MMIAMRGDIIGFASLAAAGVLLGSVGGCVVSQGLLPREASATNPGPGPKRPTLDPDPDPNPVTAADARPRPPVRMVDYAEVAKACGEGCSDYDLGIVWAQHEGITTAGQCMDYAWSYQRGCLAYLTGGRHGRPRS